MSQISFSQDNFTDLDVYTQKIQTRYRITTDDKNVTSYWSPIYLVDPMFFFTRGTIDIPGSMTVEKVGSNIRIVWSSVRLYKGLSSITFPQNPTQIDTTLDTIKINSGYGYQTGDSIVYTSTTPITGLSTNGKYYIRQINTTTFSLHPTQQDAISGTNKINLSGTPSGTGTITGNPSPISELPYYDIWIRWADTAGANPGDWIYRQRTSATSVDLIVPQYYTGTTNPKYVYVEIYRPGKPIERYEETITFNQNSTYIDTTDDTIKIPSGYRYCTGSKIQYVSSTPITGLTSTSTYYIRVIDYYTFSLHPTQTDAIQNLNKINLSGTPSGTGQIIGKPFLMYYGETNF